MDRLSPERRSENMRHIRGSDTVPEMVVRRIVHGLGYRFRLHVSTLPGKPDLVLARHRAIIDVRGCFWHGHGGCIDSHVPKTRVAYWGPKLVRNQERDRENVRLLRRAGWRVLILWECETRKPETVLRKIRRFLDPR